MLYGAENRRLDINGETIDYIAFGRGSKNLIMIPGLGDGLKTVKGAALPFAFMFRVLAKDYRVYVFSRKNELAGEYSSRQMAADLKAAMVRLGIEKADVIGVSQGGTIAQWLAVDYSESVEKLVLAVTYSRQNETVQKVVSTWIDFAQKGDYKSLFVDTAEHSYSEKYLAKRRAYLPLAAKLTEPESFERFIVMAKACLSHDAYDRLGEIRCPTLVIGGKEDKIVSAEASYEMAKLIPGAEIYMYDGLGHAAYEEAADFIAKILEFLKNDKSNKKDKKSL